MIKEYFDDIISWLVDNNRSVVKSLLGGLSPEYISRSLRSANLYDTPDIIDLYSLCGGTRVLEGDFLDDLHFFPGFYLLKFEEALNYHNSFSSDLRWEKNWFPIFANGGGDFFIVELSGNQNKFPVRGFMLGCNDSEVEFLSIRHMLQTISECYENGAYLVSENNYLDIIDIEEARIANKINPNLIRWESVLLSS